MEPPPREWWCVIAFELCGHVVTLPIPEFCIDVARLHGWSVVITESDCRPVIEPSQRNPNRRGDD